MVTYEIDDRAAPADTRKVIVNGRPYHFITVTKCRICCKDDAYLGVMKMYDGECTLECPICESLSYAKLATVVKR